jgi:hypothetical protein
MLDPHRIGLNAESIGFQKRMLQDLDFNAVNQALQTDYNNQNSAVDVRRERDMARNEIRVMGGQLSGFESNELLLTYSRQQRQINGYPLRHFDANNPAVVLPKKYGGFPLYNRNQTEYPEFVSVFTEPMSAPLQRDTELLGRAGAVAMSNDLNNPYESHQFINPMSSNMDDLDQNRNVFTQRRHLQKMSDVNRRNKGAASGAGIFMNENGSPMSTVADAVNDALPQMNTFSQATNRYGARAMLLQHHEAVMGGVSGDLQMNMNEPSVATSIQGPTPETNTSTMRANERTFVDATERSNVAYLDSSGEFDQVTQLNLSANQYTPASGRGFSQQPGSLRQIGWDSPSGTPTVDFAGRRLSMSGGNGGLTRQFQTQMYDYRVGRSLKKQLSDSAKKRAASKKIIPPTLTPFKNRRVSMSDVRGQETPGRGNAYNMGLSDF